MRLVLVGGLLSYRGMFVWLSPWIFIPSLLIAPVFQIAMFVYLGRSAGSGSDAFFVIGNALQYTAIPCLFAMSSTIAGERGEKMLGITLTSPAPRLPLFLGRSLPVMLNGWLVSAVCLTVSVALFHVPVPASALLPLALVILVTAASCTGLGLVNAGLGLRIRSTAVLSNVIFGALLILCTANVPAEALPPVLRQISGFVPLTHGIAAARDLVAGGAWSQVARQTGLELLVGAAYVAAGLVLLRWCETSGRRTGSLETE